MGCLFTLIIVTELTLSGTVVAMSTTFGIGKVVCVLNEWVWRNGFIDPPF
jgi:hypothetical protein